MSRRYEDTKKKNKYCSGLIWMNNGLKNVRVDPSEVETYLSRGYVRGRTTSTIRGRKAVNKDGVVQYVDEDLVELYLDNGWSKGTEGHSVSGVVAVVNVLNDEIDLVDVDSAKELVDSGFYKYTATFRNHMYNPETGHRIMVYPKNIQTMLDKGYVLGRPKKTTNKLYWVHNDELKENKRVSLDDLPSYISAGWIKGQGRYN